MRKVEFFKKQKKSTLHEIKVFLNTKVVIRTDDIQTNGKKVVERFLLVVALHVLLKSPAEITLFKILDNF